MIQNIDNFVSLWGGVPRTKNGLSPLILLKGKNKKTGTGRFFCFTLESVLLAMNCESREIMGWLMGLEPTTTGITIRDSTN